MLNYDDVVRLPLGNSEGILEIVDATEPDYNLAFFAFFDGKLFEDEESFATKTKEMFSKANNTVYECSYGKVEDETYFTFTNVNSTICVVVPKRTEETSIERESLSLTVRKKGLTLCLLQRIKKWNEVMFYVRLAA